MAILDRAPPSAAACHLQNAIDLIEEDVVDHGPKDVTQTSAAPRHGGAAPPASAN